MKKEEDFPAIESAVEAGRRLASVFCALSDTRGYAAVEDRVVRRLVHFFEQRDAAVAAHARRDTLLQVEKLLRLRAAAWRERHNSAGFSALTIATDADSAADAVRRLLSAATDEADHGR